MKTHMNVWLNRESSFLLKIPLFVGFVFGVYSLYSMHSGYLQLFKLFLIALLTSFFIIFFNIKHNNLFCRFTNDKDTSSVQKFHTQPVPRTAGIGIITSLLFVVYWLSYAYPQRSSFLGYLVIASLPAFIGGIIEDLTKKVGVKTRLFFISFSAVLGFFLLDAGLSRLDCPIDWILNYWIFSLLITIFTVSGVTNAINIIDGFNGLAGLVAVMILSGLSYVSYLVNDFLIIQSCCALIGSILGFLFWNYPNGRIFLGDGGAYLIGFIIAELSTLLVARHPEISAWFPLLLAFYPIFETLFSIYRKKFIRKMNPGHPDGLHLHMLIYKRLITVNGKKHIRNIIFLNAMTSPYMSALCGISLIPAVLFWNHTVVLFICCLLFMSIYLWIYGRIIHFRIPRFLLFLVKKQIAKHGFQ